jgi:predicted nucleic acid-binding protein
LSAPRFDVTKYVFDSATRYFLDTNIWFLVYGPATPGDPRAATYSDALKRLRASRAPVLIDAVVISELVNAWARFEFSRSGAAKFKTFRNSAAFRPIAEEITVVLRSILSLARPTGTAFANINLAPVLSTFEKGGSDFNDLLLVETCRANACVLVTDDGDMQNVHVPIVTARQSLLT